jgi:cyclophilin family peptidyl-prolyl cis-trans isomerase
MKNLVLFLFLTTLVLGCNQSNTNNRQDAMKDSTKTADSTTVAVIKTNMGTIECELFTQVAPKAVENFAGLAEKGYYNGIIFHRVIDKFMIQGGDPTGTGSGGQSLWGGFFDDEFNQNYKFDSAGVLAMANMGPNTNGSQFFITLVPTPWLNFHHTIFGKVISGMDVVSAIGKVATTKPMNKPVNKVFMESVTIVHRPK